MHSYAVTVQHARRVNPGVALRNERTFAVPRVDAGTPPICRRYRSHLSPITHVNPVRNNSRQSGTRRTANTFFARMQPTR